VALYAPELERVGEDFEYSDSSSSLARVQLPRLHRIGRSLLVSDAALLDSVRLPRLGHIECSISVTGENQQLREVALPGFRGFHLNHHNTIDVRVCGGCEDLSITHADDGDATVTTIVLPPGGRIESAPASTRPHCESA